MKTTILITMILTTIVVAGPTIYFRDPSKPGSTAPGYAAANGKQIPVTIVTYGADDIGKARMFGRNEADGNVPFKVAAQAIRDKAQELYPGQSELQKWFCFDAAKSFDEEKKASTK
jgi:hypothetical protein